MPTEHTAHDGFTMPAIGFGTYRCNGADGVEVISRAIDNGYRLIDSAVNYENEGAVGRAVRAASVPRDELIVTSKLPGRHHAYDEGVVTIEESLYRTGLDYLDLYLIHWPNPRVDKYVEAWTALIDARQRGLIRAIGVCNFEPEHLERLERETGVRPVVNQIELHPRFPQADLLAYDTEHGIITEAWSPIGQGNDLLEDPLISEIARAHGYTPAQTVLAWATARGAIPLPKAASTGRQTENMGAVELTLTDDEIAGITALGRPDGRNKGQDPATWEEF